MIEFKLTATRVSAYEGLTTFQTNRIVYDTFVFAQFFKQIHRLFDSTYFPLPPPLAIGKQRLVNPLSS